MKALLMDMKKVELMVRKKEVITAGMRVLMMDEK